MTLPEIDALLQTWKNRLNTAAQNLVDLRSNARYQRAAGQNLGELFERYALIQEVVDQAEKLRKDWPIFGSGEDRIREIERLLRGKSIKLPTQTVPLEERSLLSAGEQIQTVSPETLMSQLAQHFEWARDAVFGVDAAWVKLAEVKEEYSKAQSLVTEGLSKVAEWDHGALPSEEKIEGLRQWLQKLEESASQGMFQPVALGLQNWNKAADQCVTELREASERCQAALEMRNELRGRLEALKAKAQACGLAENPEVAGMARAAADSLYVRPTPLKRAATLLRSYASRLQGETKK